MINPQKQESRARSIDRKKADRVERRAANRIGITYGHREAGRASEHFEIGHGKHATHSSRKVVNGKPSRKKNEQRIVSG